MLEPIDGERRRVKAVAATREDNNTISLQCFLPLLFGLKVSWRTSASQRHNRPSFPFMSAPSTPPSRDATSAEHLQCCPCFAAQTGALSPGF